MDLLCLCEPCKRHLGTVKAGVGNGWKSRRCFYAGLMPDSASAGESV